MFGRSRSIYLISFLALLGPAVAADIYRPDSRNPETVSKDGGIATYKPDGKPSRPLEKENSVKDSISWDQIQGWDTFKDGKKVGTTTKAKYEKGTSGKKGGRDIKDSKDSNVYSIRRPFIA